MNMIVLKIIAAVLTAVIVVIAAYIAYLFITYRRIPDDIPIKTEGDAGGALPVGTELRAVSWNIGFGAYSDDFSFFMNGGKRSRAFSKQAVIDNVGAVIDRLQTMNADIMMIEEVDTDSNRAWHTDEAAMIAGAFSDRSRVFAQNYDSAYLFWPPCMPHGASKSGMLTLVRSEIKSARRMSLPVEGGFMKFLDLDRCFSKTLIPVSDGRILYLYTLHLSAYTSDGSIATRQLRILLNDMSETYASGGYIIAGGDFNKDIWQNSARYTGIPGKDYSWSKPFPVELIPRGFTLVNSLNPDKPVTSCRASETPYVSGQTFTVTLDAFIVSDNIQVKHCEVVDEGFRHSDHNPIELSFELK